jgi:hypothetical protein
VFNFLLNGCRGDDPVSSVERSDDDIYRMLNVSAVSLDSGQCVFHCLLVLDAVLSIESLHVAVI